MLGAIGKMTDDEASVKEEAREHRQLHQRGRRAAAGPVKMAKMGVAIDRWMADKQLTATAIQCWTALEELYGVVPCTIS